MPKESSPKSVEKKWRKDLAKRKPELGRIVNQILDSRNSRVRGVPISDEDQFFGLTSSSLPPTGGIRIVTDY